MNPKPVVSRTFRPEIQALRALAVLLVVAYHLQPTLLPGGYIGVDIFFVISGFLITSHLLREAERTGSVDLRAFFAGRARRILPAAMLVIVVVLFASFLILPTSQWGALGTQALASALSVQNWVLAADSVDYLASDQAPGPLQHFWSLGVEEQFYLFWPLLVVVACWYAKSGVFASKASRMTVCRRVLWITFGLVTVLSLGYSIFTGYSGDVAGYFTTTTRVWELSVGGLLALAAHARASEELRLPCWVTAGTTRNLLVLVALAAIFWAALSYDAHTVFPGVAAAVPVLSCAIVIAAGATSGPGSVHRLVRWAPVQWVGLASYSLYLWHWPLIVFFIHLAGHDPSPGQSILLLAGSLVLAWGSLRWVEVPLRSFKPWAVSPAKSLVAGALMIGLVASLSFLPGLAQRQAVAAEQRAVSALLQDPPQGLGAASMANGAPAFLPGERLVIPVPATAADDQPNLGDCIQDPQSIQIHECEFGSHNATFTVALVGDSHAAHWFEAVMDYANLKRWKVVTYLKNSCPFNAAQRVAERDGSINCQEANEQTIKELTGRGDVNAVLTANWGGSTFTSDPALGLVAQWRALEDAGLPVYAIVDTPRPARGGYVRECVEEHLADPQHCSFPAQTAFESGDVTKEAAKREPDVEVLDFSDQFCLHGTCPAVVGNVLVYRDKHHISDSYMRTLGPVFGQRLEAALESR